MDITKSQTEISALTKRLKRKSLVNSYRSYDSLPRIGTGRVTVVEFNGIPCTKQPGNQPRSLQSVYGGRRSRQDTRRILAVERFETD